MSGAQEEMSRRKMVQRLLGGAGAGIALPAVASLHPSHAQPSAPGAPPKAVAQAQAAAWTPSFFDSHQNENLIVLAERLVPGSTQAQVNRFLDLVLAAKTQETQQKFFNALAAFDGQSLDRYGRPFKDLSESQQVELLTLASKQEPGKSAEGAAEPARVTLRDHFEVLKGWVSEAYYSSEVGMKELGWTGEHFFTSFPGCEHPEGHH